MRLNTRTNDVFKIWLKIPTLKEICWEALLHYNSKIRLSSHTELLNMGIPQDLASRVHPAPPCGYGPQTSRHWASDLLPSLEPTADKVSQGDVENAPFAIGY